MDVLRNGDIVFAFAGPRSSNVIRRWDAQTGAISVIGSIGAGDFDAASLEFIPDSGTPVVAAIASLSGSPARIHTVDAEGRTVLAVQPYAGYDGNVEVACADFTGDEVPDILAGSGGEPAKANTMSPSRPTSMAASRMLSVRMFSREYRRVSTPCASMRATSSKAR